jgi:hypothetical protein
MVFFLQEGVLFHGESQPLSFGITKVNKKEFGRHR